MRLIISCILLLTSCFYSNAGQSLIQGNAPDYKGKFVRLYVYDDYITYTEKELTSTRVGLDGKFELWFTVTETQYAFIRIDNEILDLYIEKDNKYKIYFPPPFINTEATNPLSERNYHKLILPASDTTSLNFLIQKFNQMCDDFLYNNKELIVRRGMNDKKLLQDRLTQLRDAAGEEFSFSGNVYLKDHIQYSVAQLEVLTIMTDFKLFENYFINKPFLEYNYEFMEFFHQHFENHLKLFSLTVQGSSFVKSINNFTSIAKVNQALHLDEKLKNKILRDAVLIDGLIQLYNNPNYKKEQIVKALDSLTVQAATSYLKTAANNARIQLTRNQPGTQAPEFEIRSHNNQLKSLKDFSGKYVYLQFTDVNCLPCNSETKTVSDLQKKYGKKIEFITITINNDFEETRNFVSANAYNWNFLIAGKDHKVLENYNVKSVPEYFLINPEGKFIQSPALRPDRGIDRTFFDLK